MLRRAFTLVEMLVVIFIILVLAALVVAFAPRLAERQKVPQGASELQGWLLIAKQRAKRDQLPTGVRLVPDASGLVRSLQYVQKPDDWTGGPVQIQPDAQGNLNTVSLVEGANFLGGYNKTDDPTLFPIQSGDYIELKGGGLVKKIVSVSQAQLTLLSPANYPISKTGDYRVIRHMRPLIGEANLDLPTNIVIDTTTNTKYSNPLTPPEDGAIDIIFGPSGALLDCVGSDGVVCLWVRDASMDFSLSDPATWQGEHVLVCIYKTTGMIASHPVSLNPSDPYAAAKDGRSSGL